MKAPQLPRWAWWSGAGLVIALGVAVSLPYLPFFRMRQVEVVGARFNLPTSVVAAARFDIDQNIFDRLGPHEQEVQSMPGIVDANIERRLPGTLRIAVVERVPVALVAGPDQMVALDWEAQPLPFDPAANVVDLPVVKSADSVLTGALATLVVTDPELYAEVQSAERHLGGVRMTLRAGRIVLNANPSLEEVRNLGAIWRRVSEDATPFDELDGRFAGMVLRRGETG